MDQDNQGVFITFEGGEGVGKSTQIRLLEARLEASGLTVVRLREPGGTRIGEKIREILLNVENTELDAVSELLLYEAARAQLVTERIKPALDSGCVVLCDRFTDSTLAYQGIARGLGIDMAERANDIGSKGLVPARTIVLTRDVTISLEKASAHGADRLELEGVDFHTCVHKAFVELAHSQPKRVRLVTCQPSKEATALLVYQELADLFPESAASFEITPEIIQHTKAT